MIRFGFCCDHACVQANAINIAARREMRFVHRAIGEALKNLDAEFVYILQPENHRIVVETRLYQENAVTKPLKHGDGMNKVQVLRRYAPGS